jgi:hypothetical protein
MKKYSHNSFYVINMEEITVMFENKTILFNILKIEMANSVVNGENRCTLLGPYFHHRMSYAYYFLLHTAYFN